MTLSRSTADDLNYISIIPFLFTLNMINLELDVNGAPQYLLNDRVYHAIEDRKFTFPAEKRIVLYKSSS